MPAALHTEPYVVKTWRRGTAPRAAVTYYAAKWVTGRLLARVLRQVFRRNFFPLGFSWAELRGAWSAPLAFLQTYRHDRRVRRRAGRSQNSDAPTS